MDESIENSSSEGKLRKEGEQFLASIRRKETCTIGVTEMSIIDIENRF